MRIFLISIFIILAYYNGITQTINTVFLADSLVKQGTFKASVVTYEYPQDIKELQNKALKSLKNNPNWHDKYIVHLVAVGAKDLEYVDGMGLTKEEFNKLLAAFKRDKDVILIDTFTIVIKKLNGMIAFSSGKIASAFNKLKIDTRKKEITYEHLKLTREVKAYGQKFFAPKLQGFEAHGSQVFIQDNGKNTTGSFGLCVGVNKGETRPTLCLMRILKSSAEPEFLTITIL